MGTDSQFGTIKKSSAGVGCTIMLVYFFFFFFNLFGHATMACRILVPQPGIHSPAWPSALLQSEVAKEKQN